MNTTSEQFNVVPCPLIFFVEDTEFIIDRAEFCEKSKQFEKLVVQFSLDQVDFRLTSRRFVLLFLSGQPKKHLW